MVIWTYVSAYLGVAGEVDEANVAVARVACIFRGPAAVGAVTEVVSWAAAKVYSSSIIVVKPRENAVFENAQIGVPNIESA